MIVRGKKASAKSKLFLINNQTVDSIPLDPVIYDATLQQEAKINMNEQIINEITGERIYQNYDIVITVQPTSPLLKTKTLDLAIETLINSWKNDNPKEQYDLLLQ